MKELIAAMAVCLVVACPFSAAQPKKRDVASEALLDGAWKIVAIEFGMLKDIQQMPLKGPPIEQIIVVRNGNLVIPDSPDRGLLRLKIDAAKQPGRLDVLDMIEMEDNAKGKGPLKCIYSLKKDTLKVMFHHGVGRPFYIPFLSPEAPRPTGFDDTELPSVTLTLQRLSN